MEELTRVFKDMFDGAMLGDGSLVQPHNSAYFHMAQSGVAHIDWVEIVALALSQLGVPISKGYPRQTWSVSRGRRYDRYELLTRSSEWLTEQRERWYPKGVKIVPPDIELNGLLLAHWFMGDGSSGWVTSGLVRVEFSTDNYDVNSLMILRAQLELLGLRPNRVHDHGPVCISSKEGVFRLMAMISPHITSSFRYKIKLPIGGSDGNNTRRY